jgi:hypothetical protein
MPFVVDFGGGDERRTTTHFISRTMAKLSYLAVGMMAVASAQDQPILDPAPYTVWTATSSDGLSRRAEVSVPFTNSSGADDFVNIWRADLIGDATQRGIAQGELFAAEIVELVEVALPDFFIEMVNSLDLSMLPEWLADKIYEVLDELAPPAFYKAMQAVWDHESQYVPPRLVTEMGAIAQGVCNVMQKQNMECDVADWTAK